MLTAVKLVDQWSALERRLPADWETVDLRLRTEQPGERSEAARILGPMNAGFVGEELAFTVRRAGGASGPQAARRLFGRLDEARIWCLLEQRDELDSSALLTRAALICAPINPTRSHDHVGFTFRCARTTGYGVSPGMARRCFEELDSEGIGGQVSVLRSLSGTQNVATQGAVWYVGGKVL